MKRFISLCIALCCIVVSAVAYERASFDWNISTSAVSYGSAAVRQAVKSVTVGDYTHLVISGETGTSVKLDDVLFGTVSLTPVADIYTGNMGEAILLDYSGNAGLRMYPGIGGMNIGVEYSLGCRQDYFRSGEEDGIVSFTPFGNGFRFIAEYDFSIHTSGYAPVVGVAWRHMPRGNNESDNIFSLYVSFQNN